jgi:DNA-binding NarL/FixJ family response regulator
MWRGRERLDAIQKAQQLHPDLILLDLSMPVMNGLESARELTKLMPEIPLMMFTSYVGRAAEQEAYDAGVRRIVPKTHPFDGLMSAARELLN